MASVLGEIYPAKKFRIPTIATTHSDGSRDRVRRNDRHRRLVRARASGHAAALLNQFPPSDGDWHVPLSVRGLPSNRNNTTPRESSLQGRTFAVNINLPLAADMVEEIERVACA